MRKSRIFRVELLESRVALSDTPVASGAFLPPSVIYSIVVGPTAGPADSVALAPLPQAQASNLSATDAAIATDPTRNVAELTAKWWEWAVGIPTSQNPQLDQTGKFAGVDQPYKGSKVFFLAGAFNGGTAERSITVPQGTSFFFPLVNDFSSDFRRGTNPANNPTVPQLYAIVEGRVDTVHDLFVTLDGVSRLDAVQRVKSPPFALKLPEDNIFGAPAGEYAPGVSDGYWLSLPALPPGKYDLNFGGVIVIDAVNASQDITYHITVE